MADNPQRDNVPAGTYAIRVGQKQQIFRLRESDDPFSDDLEWEKVSERSIKSIPKSSYDGGRWEVDGDGKIWFYVDNIKPESGSDTAQKQLDETAPYAIKIRGPDGRTFNVTGSMQASVFADTVEILIEEYDLAEKLNEMQKMPYIPGYKNAILSDEPRHPNGDEMERKRAIAGGSYYVATQPTKDQKIKYLNDFATIADVEIAFENGWED